MSEAENSTMVGLFLGCEFLTGAIVGAFVRKDRDALRRGMVTTAALALLMLMYGATLGTLRDLAFKTTIEAILGVLGVLLFLLTVGFCIWLTCVLVALSGYWTSVLVFRRIGFGPGKVTLLALFALMSVVAAITALTRIGVK